MSHLGEVGGGDMFINDTGKAYQVSPIPQADLYHPTVFTC